MNSKRKRNHIGYVACNMLNLSSPPLRGHLIDATPIRLPMQLGSHLPLGIHLRPHPLGRGFRDKAAHIRLDAGASAGKRRVPNSEAAAVGDEAGFVATRRWAAPRCPDTRVVSPARRGSGSAWRWGTTTQCLGIVIPPAAVGACVDVAMLADLPSKLGFEGTAAAVFDISP